ncbi:hypothetical protein [Butyrivibrio sp.]|nr:hypothetical protein [Butyrivibrio sp.]MBQ9304854.1 hypothetical protein [Butyrivibrio sp.]
MAGMANGSRKLLLKINAYIARELDLGRTAIVIAMPILADGCIVAV